MLSVFSVTVTECHKLVKNGKKPARFMVLEAGKSKGMPSLLPRIIVLHYSMIKVHMCDTERNQIKYTLPPEHIPVRIALIYSSWQRCHDLIGT